jgi:rhamnogalacturonyl hydrolase YesR
MKKLLLTAFVATVGWMGAAPVNAQTLPDSKNTLETVMKVNDHFMKEWPDPGQPTYVGRMRSSSLWTRAVYYEGLMALYEIYPDARYFQYAYDWGEFHKWTPRNGSTNRNADNYCCSQTFIDMYRITHEWRMIQHAKVQMDMLVNTPQVNDWWWIDAIQMGMPVFAKLGKETGDSKYFNKMWEMYAYTRNQHGDKGMFNAKEGLWWRDQNFDPPYKEPNGKDCFWSRGNGWVYAALVRVMNEIPANEPHRADYLSDFLAMSKALKACQRSDGFWNVSLHDENHFGGKETSGTSLFVYGMAWGIRNGLLDRKEYLPVVLKAWNALVTEAVHEDGRLGYVQGTGKEPKDGQPVTFDHMPDFDDYGVGCFLLAGTEVYKLK